MYKNIVTQTLRNPLHNAKGIGVDVLRLDKIHRDISGNKWFKLKYFIEEAIAINKTGIVTFGGAYSNHLVATAAACRENRLQATGIIRGEEAGQENASVKQMKDAGMELRFISRDEYRCKEQVIENFLADNPDYYYVPEGGRGSAGIKGAGEILQHAERQYSHIIVPVGTGTTFAGLINASSAGQQVMGISALKIADRQTNELTAFIDSAASKQNWCIQYDYHFGGYARKTNDLVAFMNKLYKEENIPTDFVYTAKMFFGVYDLESKDYFPPGSSLLLIHTGGLQGNRSLPDGTLAF